MENAIGISRHCCTHTKYPKNVIQNRPPLSTNSGKARNLMNKEECAGREFASRDAFAVGSTTTGYPPVILSNL